MLLRKEAQGLIAISQPAHAWVSGQLARHWGNAQFGHFAPPEEVYLAAALHDIGFLNWEQAPTLHPPTGLPHTFRNLPAGMHFELWSKSVVKMLRYGRYPALLVSLHFVHLCQKHHTLESREEVDLKQAFINTQEAFQTTILNALKKDSYYAPFITPECLQRNRQLLAVWDWLSLTLCIDFEGEMILEGVPMANGCAPLSLVKRGPSRILMHPWPFAHATPAQPVILTCEGRQLLGTFKDETRMQEALRAAAPVVIRMELVDNP